jgi:hypothetical protein
MRRASTCLAVLGLIVLAAPAVATAEEEIPSPKVTLKAKAVPIPGFRGTGNFYGKGADVEAEFKIEGSGYGKGPGNPNGSPPPISAINFYLPKGTKLHPQGFKTCTNAKLKAEAAIGCPKGSIASPLGAVLGEVVFEGERVPEEATLQAFFGPSESLLFFTKYHRGAVFPSAPLGAPAQVEIVSEGRYKRSHGKYAYELETKVPAVETVQGAPLASVSLIKIKAGAAMRRHKKVIYYGTLPKKGECPKKGFPVKAEVFFGGNHGSDPVLGNREFGIAEKEVTAEFPAPCPKH